MVCLNPKPVKFNWYTKIDEKTGEVYKTKNIRFIPWDKEINENTDWIPCGKCAGCRIDHANDIATKAYLESQKHNENCFVTLTYDNEHLPKHRTLKKEDLQKFWKRLRKKGYKIRYIACGEYGPRTLRPHYHAIIFGYWPKDAKPFKKNETGDILFTSEELQKIWGHGFVILGLVSYESAAYVARYVYKKAYGADEIPLKQNKQKEFTTCSKRPGISLSYFQNPEEWEKIIRNNGVIIPTKNGIKIRPIPNYLRKKWKNNEREKYFQWTEENKQKLKKIQTEILKKTDKNFGWYRQQNNQIKKEQLKRLDKRTDL